MIFPCNSPRRPLEPPSPQTLESDGLPHPVEEPDGGRGGDPAANDAAGKGARAHAGGGTVREIKAFLQRIVL